MSHTHETEREQKDDRPIFILLQKMCRNIFQKGASA